MTQASPSSNSNWQNPSPSIHSFIVKIWLEETRKEAGRNIWRGHVTHVPSNHRVYFKDLKEILIFIMPYLEDMEIESGGLARLMRCLKICLPRLFALRWGELEEPENNLDDELSD